MSVLLARHGVPETVQVEVQSGIDGQGKPAYDTAVEIDAFVRREDKVVRTAIQLMRPGEEVQHMATVWIDAAETPKPSHGDRLTLADGLVGSVAERKDVKTLAGVLDHVRLKLREQ